MTETERLIHSGYFPKELPIEFTSIPLANNFALLDATISSAKLEPAEPEIFSLARSGHARRPLRIPNPLHYIRQAKIIGDHWSEISAITDASPLSLSKPVFDPKRTRATSLRPAMDLPERRLWALSSKQYVLQTDITRFFASIYTHSIPWALHGKSKAKTNRKTGGALFGNDIDKAIRDGQSGQTIGIPVGPDTSHIISELIAAQIDARAFKTAPLGYRYVDDYFLCFSTESEARNALNQLTVAAREFELDINYEKTSIKRIDQVTDEVGPLNDLNGFDFGTGDEISRRSLHAFFGIATKLSATQENALKYAIRIMAQRDVSANDWPVLESYLLRAGTLSSNSLDVVAYMLYRHSLKGAPLDRNRIIDYLGEIITIGIAYGLNSDVTWALWAFKALQYVVPEEVVKALSQADNSVVALLALDLQNRGLLKGTLSTTTWTRLLTPRGLYGEHWLLIYESVRKGWLTPKSSIIADDPLFSLLDAHGVYFYDESRTDHLVAELRSRPKTDAKKTNRGPIQWFLLAVDKPVVHAEPAMTEPRQKTKSEPQMVVPTKIEHPVIKTDQAVIVEVELGAKDGDEFGDDVEHRDQSDENKAREQGDEYGHEGYLNEYEDDEQVDEYEDDEQVDEYEDDEQVDEYEEYEYDWYV